MSNPSYHDVVVYVNGQAHKISDNYAYELICTRAGGWELWFHPGSNWTGMVDNGKAGAKVERVETMPTRGTKAVLLGGEFDGSDFRIEVNGITVCAGEPSTKEE